MRPPTTSKLRREIDTGRTGDKVDHPDPAAAPLGTDEEAAGTPVPEQAVAEAVRHEQRIPAYTGSGGSTIGDRPLLIWLLIVLGAVIIATSVFLA